MKKVGKLLLISLISLLSLTACSNNDADKNKNVVEKQVGEKITEIEKDSETKEEETEKVEDNKDAEADDNKNDEKETSEEENPNENLGNEDLKAGNTYAEVDRFIEHKTYGKLKLSDFTHLEEVDMPSNGDEEFGESHKFKLKDGFIVVRDLNGKVTRIRIQADSGEGYEINDEPEPIYNK